MLGAEVLATRFGGVIRVSAFCLGEYVTDTTGREPVGDSCISKNRGTRDPKEGCRRRLLASSPSVPVRRLVLAGFGEVRDGSAVVPDVAAVAIGRRESTSRAPVVVVVVAGPAVAVAVDGAAPASGTSFLTCAARDAAVVRCATLIRAPGLGGFVQARRAMPLPSDPRLLRRALVAGSFLTGVVRTLRRSALGLFAALSNDSNRR